MAYSRMTSPFRMQRLSVLTVVLALVCLTLGCLMAPPRAEAMSTIDFLTSLSDNEIEAFQVWKSAQQNFEEKLDAYWNEVEGKRRVRRHKRARDIRFTAHDYVMSFPPRYRGPSLSGALAAKYGRFLDAQRDTNPSPRKELATISDYLEAAKRVYNFVPERVSEKEFKLRYAAEAAALGLSKEQVVRVYALETGGVGTYDTQAGIHPIKKTGRAISSALGYGQLLDANSVNELQRSGATFIRLLTAKYHDPSNSPHRKAQLKHKLIVLRKMYANVKRKPFEWHIQQAYAKTPAGMGIHALNIDGDIGPMLQAMKLKTLTRLAAETGRHSLSGAELELMNLAGPTTGLEMMDEPGASAPTANFFSRRAYYVNKMVKGLTGSQLRAELNRRMMHAITAPGSQEFANAFDAVAARRGIER